MGSTFNANQLFGLDGCTDNAWVVAESDPALTAIRFSITSDLTSIFERAERNEVVVVLDVPIGLTHDERACDREARRLLKERRSSVFTPPCREALSASNYNEAKIINRTHCGKAISQQAFNIRERIRAVDDMIGPPLQQRIRESHPEVAFAVLNGSRPLLHNKNTPDGVAERMALLTAAGVPRSSRSLNGVGSVSRSWQWTMWLTRR